MCTPSLSLTLSLHSLTPSLLPSPSPAFFVLPSLTMYIGTAGCQKDDWRVHKLKCNDIRAVSYRSLVLPTLLLYVFFVIVILFLLFKYHMYIYLSYYYFDIAQIHERRMRERRRHSKMAGRIMNDRELIDRRS